METEEKDFLDDVETSHIKPKKQLSEQKLKPDSYTHLTLPTKRIV